MGKLLFDLAFKFIMENIFFNFIDKPSITNNFQFNELARTAVKKQYSIDLSEFSSPQFSVKYVTRCRDTNLLLD